jgi:hypothetical protein
VSEQRTYGGLADARGYVDLGDQRFHVSFLQRVDIGLVSSISGLTEEQLREWARGAALPLNLWPEPERRRT